MTNQSCKQTTGKPRISLVPPALIEQVARVREYGTAKYGGDSNSWRSVYPENYMDAIGRHLCACMRDGENAIDKESGLPHMAHIACNAGFILEMLEQKP